MVDLAKIRSPPSTGAHASEMRTQQSLKKIDAVYNGRPLSLLPTPIVLYHPVFAQFTRDLSSDLHCTSQELVAARNLIAISSQFFKLELDRQNEMAEVLRTMFGKRGVVLHETTFSTSRSTCKSDGHHSAECWNQSRNGQTPEAFDLLVQWKPDFGEGTCNPMSQAECVYVALCSTDTVGSELFPNLKMIYHHQLIIMHLVRIYPCCLLLSYISPRIRWTIPHHSRSRSRRPFHYAASHSPYLPRHR